MQPARNTTGNRARIIEAEHSQTGQAMPQSIAGAVLQVMAMEDGVAKNRIYSVASVIGQIQGPMSIQESVGRAFLLKMTNPIEFIELARRSAATTAASDTTPEEQLQIHELPRAISGDGRGKHLYVFGLGPNLTTFASATSEAAALEIVQRPGHPHYNCTVEEVNAAIRRSAAARADRRAL